MQMVQESAEMERVVKELHGSKVGDGDVVEDIQLFNLKSQQELLIFCSAKYLFTRSLYVGLSWSKFPILLP